MAWPTDISDTLADEAKEYRILKELGNQRTSSGTATYTSLTSHITYNEATNGQNGLMAQIAVAIADSLVSAAKLGHIGSLISTIIITSATTLTVSQFGNFIECGGTAPYTVTVPTPVSNSGYILEFWNNTSGTITLSTPAGQFKGIGFTAGSSYAIGTGCYIFIVSDGSNYFLSDSSLAATQATGDNSNKIATDAFVTTAILNVGGNTGWMPLLNTFVYASADSPTFTMTVSGIDLTGIISVGMRIKLTQSSTIKYFIVTAISFSTNTTITLYGGTDYTLANATISSVYYSVNKVPFGFPIDPTKWSVKVNIGTNYSQSSPVTGTTYNLGGISITIPIGAWHVSAQAAIRGTGNGTNSFLLAGALSTGASSISDAELEQHSYVALVSENVLNLKVDKDLTLASKTPMYLVELVTVGTVVTLTSENAPGSAVLRAVCAYI